VSCGPHFSQKGKVKAKKKLAFAGRMWPAGRMLPPPDLGSAAKYLHVRVPQTKKGWETLP